jgi:hypothetical protein
MSGGAGYEAPHDPAIGRSRGITPDRDTLNSEVREAHHRDWRCHPGEDALTFAFTWPLVLMFAFIVAAAGRSPWPPEPGRCSRRH